MVSDLQDGIEKFPTAPQDGGQSHVQATGWTNHSSIIQPLHSNKKRIWNLKIEAKDLDNRVRAQSGTIFALIANRHAEATRLDSGSMKTIAIMTMAFLPGTFLAALFAVPSLDWSGPKVITNNFWVYWAFTIPFTLVVFTIWYILSLDHPLKKLTDKARASRKTLGIN
ncbi:hypothetical protein F5883DRAFT_554810 [Diaporthe sp. PMI_573]|nr:hypothetical protein F5883DRAFT_554810 [Diaporthaceae sp. PMI_573]